jgi:aspartate ammonia-lyase
MDYRIEHDSMGEMKVPYDALWGAQTQRSLENFKIGAGIETMPREIIHAFGVLKKAAAITNNKLRPEKMTDEKLEAIKAAGIVVDEENSNIGLVPNMTTPVSDVAVAKAINKFVSMLEDLEDVQDVYTNMETTDEVDAALEAEG